MAASSSTTMSVTIPATALHHYRGLNWRMATRLGINTTLKNLRHFNATELMSAGVDPRTVAGRLGHGGGATTLRLCTAWSAEADQRAASRIALRMPQRPRSAEPAEADLVPAARLPEPDHRRPPAIRENCR